MAIDIDSSARFLGQDRLAELVRAVERADPNDESRWLEWKAHLDLGTREHVFKIGKAILGLANRTPDQAETWADGFGYLLVGVEPARLTGIEVIDISMVESKVRGWVGGGLRSPRWTATWVNLDGKYVLVAEVAPPEQGDPLFPLRQTYDKFREGTVFVRRQASSDPADAEEILHLSERAAGRRRLHLTVAEVAPERLVALDLTDEAVAEAVATERDACMKPLVDVQDKARREKDERRERMREQNPLYGAALADLATSIQVPNIGGFGLGLGEDRSHAEYQEQVEQHLRAYEAAILDVTISRLIETGPAEIRLSMSNPSERHIPAVRVTALVNGPVFVETDDRATDMPSRPRPFGTSRGSSIDHLLPRIGDPFYDPAPPVTSPAAPIEVQHEAGVEIRWPPTELPPMGTVELDPIAVAICPPPASDELEIAWSATSSGFDGVVRGTLTLRTQRVVPDVSKLTAVLLRE